LHFLNIREAETLNQFFSQAGIFRGLSIHIVFNGRAAPNLRITEPKQTHSPFSYFQLASVMRHQDIRRLLMSCPPLGLTHMAGQKEENKDFYFFMDTAEGVIFLYHGQQEK